MAKKSALNGKVYISTDGGSNYTEIGEMKNVDIDDNVDMQDATTNSSGGYKEFLPGLGSWTATADAFYNASDAGQAVVKTVLTGKTLCNFKFVPEVASGAEKWTGAGYISAKKLNIVNLDGPIATNLTITGSGALTYGVQ